MTQSGSPTVEDSPLSGLRVVMLCDDQQIDRRILQEAESLHTVGCDVIVLGRSGDDHASAELDGGVKIERLDYAPMSDARALRAAIDVAVRTMEAERAVATPAAEDRPEPTPTALDLDAADRELADALQFPDYGSPGFQRWTLRQPWLMRNLIRATVWPPMRLDAMRRFAPGMHWTLQYALYLPTLLLTPRPAAIRWHWQRVRRRVASLKPRRSATLSPTHATLEDAGPTTPSASEESVPAPIGREAQLHEAAMRAHVSRFDDLNVWELALYDRAVFYRPDVVHAHDLPQLRAGFFAARALGVPLVYDAHEMYPYIKTLTTEQQERYKIVEGVFMPLADRTITVNPFIAQRQSCDYDIPEPTVILNAAAVPSVGSEDAGVGDHGPLRRAVGAGPGDKVLLFQGWISIDRSIGDLVLAMADVPSNVHLALLGYGTDIPTIRKMAAQAGVAARVHFLTPVPQRELMSWVLSADAGVIPYQAVDENHRLCSPNKLFEFIAAGVPVIANDLPYLRQVVAGEGFGVVRPFDGKENYALAIREMFDPALGGESRFRDALRTRAEPFLWPAQERVLLDLYLSVSKRAEAIVAATERAGSDARSALAAPGASTGSAHVAGSAPSQAAQRPERTLRVFHGLYNIAGIPSIMARAERAIGLESKAICFPAGGFGYEPDIVEQPAWSAAEIRARFRRYASEYDVFVFHFGHSMANETLADIPLLKRMGKKVVFYFHGCDIRQSKETIRKYRYSACKVCWPQRCNVNRDHALAVALEHADAVWVSTPDLLEFVPGAELFLQPIEPARIGYAERSAPSGGAPIRIIHAPSDSRLKGSEYLSDAIPRLQDRGVPVVLDLLQGLPHDEVIRRLQGTDLAVDQLLIGSYGMFAVEAMAAGTPVVCYLREDLVDRYPEKPPIAIASPDDIEEVIRSLASDPSQWASWSARSRRYVENHHDAGRAAQRAARTYRRLQTGLDARMRVEAMSAEERAP